MMPLSVEVVLLAMAVVATIVLVCAGCVGRRRARLEDRVLLSTTPSVESFTCVRCRRPVPVEDGSYDCLPDHCDDCWVAAHDAESCLRCRRLG